MRNRLLFYSLFISSMSFAMIKFEKKAFEYEQKMIKLERKSFKSEPHLRGVDILHKGTKIYAQNGENKPVRILMMGENLKENVKVGINSSKIGKSYLYLEEVSGQYKIDCRQKLTGEGPVGATIGAFTGRFLTYGIWEGVIAVVKGSSGSEGAGEALRASAAPAIENIAKPVSIGLGIVFAVLIPW